MGWSQGDSVDIEVEKVQLYSVRIAVAQVSHYDTVAWREGDTVRKCERDTVV